jgi:Major Facilitator Superfamily
VIFGREKSLDLYFHMDEVIESSGFGNDGIYRHERDGPYGTLDGEEENKKSNVAIEATENNSATTSRRPMEQLDIENASLSTALEDVFPEGGREAWLVVLGSTLALYGSFGFMVSIGTLQDYWAENQLRDYSARDIGWIPSVFVYLALSLGIYVGPLFDRYGPKYIALFGSIGYVVMAFLLAECKLYWQFLLCCGFLGGVTGATLTTTSLAVVAHWFKSRRGLAQGLSSYLETRMFCSLFNSDDQVFRNRHGRVFLWRPHNPPNPPFYPPKVRIRVEHPNPRISFHWHSDPSEYSHESPSPTFPRCQKETNNLSFHIR